MHLPADFLLFLRKSATVLQENQMQIYIPITLSQEVDFFILVV